MTGDDCGRWNCPDARPAISTSDLFRFGAHSKAIPLSLSSASDVARAGLHPEEKMRRARDYRCRKWPPRHRPQTGQPTHHRHSGDGPYASRWILRGKNRCGRIRRGNVAFGLARKQRLTGRELMPTWRAVDIDIGPDVTLADRAAVEFQLAGANRQTEVIPFSEAPRCAIGPALAARSFCAMAA